MVEGALALAADGRSGRGNGGLWRDHLARRVRSRQGNRAGRQQAGAQGRAGPGDCCAGPPGAAMTVRILLAVLWPAFLVAGLAEGLLFSMFNPDDIQVFGVDVELSRMAAYTIGFFMLWG